MLNAPEIRPKIGQTPLERARERDLQARTLDGILKSSWAALGLLCRDVKKDEDWKVLGFHSLDAWIEDALPYARSTARDALRLVEELAPDFLESELMNIPHDTAHVLRALPSSMRRDPGIKQAAADLKPKAFRQKMATEHPDHHVEIEVRKVFWFSSSQWDTIKKKIEQYIAEHGEMSYEDVIEAAFADWEAK